MTDFEKTSIAQVKRQAFSKHKQNKKYNTNNTILMIFTMNIIMNINIRPLYLCFLVRILHRYTNAYSCVKIHLTNTKENGTLYHVLTYKQLN